MLKRQILTFFASLMFFSRIPVPFKHYIADLHFQKAVRYLPLIGFIVGLTGGLVMYYTSHILPVSMAVLLGIMVTILFTGGLHEDGLADVCDGFGGGYYKQKILDIMKDSHIGTYGVIGLILSLLFRYASLTEMPRYFMALFFVTGNILSRFTLVTVMYKHKYARSNESSKSIGVIGQLSFIDLIVAASPAVIAFWVIGSYTFLLVLIPVWLTKWLMALYFKKKIGGYTGDCLGAIQQSTEIVFYLSSLIWLKFTW
jgi:adenosylcobinamide-GDP ribazoletransferase